MRRRRRRRVVPSQELINRAKNRRPTRPHIGQDWWYIVTKEQGAWVVAGPYSDAREAEEIAIAKITTDYEIVAMNTRDRDEATRRVRHKVLLRDGGSLSESLQRMKHTI